MTMIKFTKNIEKNFWLNYIYQTYRMTKINQ